ncbi:hypothetical protein [Rheinheimera baltica]|uniref:hypothetical protein n=1 Tax=Rheinheimera baltica TaxID=67576 RepID=UPI00146ECF08|nr:hypothetical protein [Rheinheimera baltica]
MSSQTVVYVASGTVDAEVGVKRVSLQEQHTLSLSNETGSVQLSSADSAQVIFIRLSVNE